MGDCREAIGDEALLDWWTGEPVADRRALELHLLGCEPCSARLARLQLIAGGIGQLLRAGDLPAVIGPAVLERLRLEGLQIREYAVPAGGGVRCSVSPDDDLLLARLAADLRGVSRLDLVSRIDDGPERRLADLPFDARAGELLLIPPVTLIRARPDHLETMQLLDVGAAGERLLGRYEFHHSAWGGVPR